MILREDVTSMLRFCVASIQTHLDLSTKKRLATNLMICVLIILDTFGDCDVRASFLLFATSGKGCRGSMPHQKGLPQETIPAAVAAEDVLRID